MNVCLDYRILRNCKCGIFDNNFLPLTNPDLPLVVSNGYGFSANNPTAKTPTKELNLCRDWCYYYDVWNERNTLTGI